VGTDGSSGHGPPTSAEELLRRYAEGERDFESANLSGANLVRANLSGAKLRNAKLRGANLVRANLSDADLVGANLRKAKLCSANLTPLRHGKRWTPSRSRRATALPTGIVEQPGSLSMGSA